ncbi:MAG: magnesium and cobalt exporter, family [Acidobacteriota bacterium]|nr:magnesium and cobalt exporter, family [Acidobacteriota bacterium]MDT5062411.1 magnesium and cobalt exporter, family [Acidobacteriota bacterium]
MGIEIVITCLLLVGLTFLATVDMAFGQLSDVGLRLLIAEAEERASAAAAFLKEIQEDRPRFRFTLGASIQIQLVAVSVLITSILLRWFYGLDLLLLALFTGLVLAGIFRQLIPRLISLRNPEKTLLALLPAVKPFYHLLSFVADPLNRRAKRLRRERESAEKTDEDEEDEDNGGDIQALIDVGAEEGILEEEEGELIHSIIEFGDTRVNEVMTPRTEIVALPLTATVREARDAIIESKYSRLPVYREQIDNVEGIIYVRDLLQCWPEGKEDEKITRLLRPVYFVPETKSVADLLEEMQKARVQLAMVIDEYGGVAGLVTVEDILEEIVGEIEDEDTEQEEIVEIIQASDGYYDVLGSTEIGKIERLFSMEIEDDDFTTIAGLVISESGYMPRAGERLTFRGLDVEVLEADDKRINRLRLRRAEESKAQAE